MAMNTRMGVAAANAATDAVTALANAALVQVYTGLQPATPDTPLSGQQLLATIVLPNPAFAAAVGGVAAANVITSVTIAETGIAAWFRVMASDTVTPLFDGSVGTSDANMVIATTSLVQNAQLVVNSCTFSTLIQGA